MVRKIKYKPISKELEGIVKPDSSTSTRVSVGLDKVVGEYYYINTEQLQPFKNQARKSFNIEEIKKLASSIKEYGIRQPLTVAKSIDGEYEVISGERRLRAAKEIGLNKVPCIILKEDMNADAVALVENIHRKDLHPIELGSAYRQLIESKVFKTQEELADSISVAKSKVSECIKLSKIPDDVKNFIIDKNIVSRDVLRKVLKANSDNDKEKMKRVVGLDTHKQNRFSVLRVMFSDGEIKVQDSGIKKLTDENKKEVIENLKNVVDKINSL